MLLLLLGEIILVLGETMWAKLVMGETRYIRREHIIQTGSANGQDLSILQFVEPYSHHSSNFNQYDKSSTILLSPELNSFQNKSSFAKLTEVNLL